MIKIFDQKAYIEIYIKQGFKNINSWQQDAMLYVRWLKLPYEDGGCGRELSKKECKEELIRICKKSVPMFSEISDYKKIDNIIKKAWADKRPLYQIKDIAISHTVLSWFKKQGLKKNELKLLFTLYVGYLIKKKGMGYDNAERFKQIKDREFLRGNSNITTACSIKKTLNIFRDKKFIEITGDNFYLTFIKQEDFIECENNVSNLLILTGDDLYNVGDALLKFYADYRYCEQCGKLIPNDIKNKRFCDDCAKIRKYKPQEIKVVQCIDCGIEFETSSKNNKKEYRCEKCAKIYRRKYQKTLMENRRKCDSLAEQMELIELK